MTEIDVLQDGHDTEKNALKYQKIKCCWIRALGEGESIELSGCSVLQHQKVVFYPSPPLFFFLRIEQEKLLSLSNV